MNQELIEKCIEIRGDRAYDGSYAAPREAYRAVLQQAYEAGQKDERARIRGVIEGMKGKYGFNEYMIMNYNEVLDDALALATLTDEQPNTDEK